MITVNYFTKDCFKQRTAFISAKAENTEENIRMAFHAMKKEDATVFISEDTHERITHGVRYEVYPYFDDTGNLKTCVKKTCIEWVEGIQNESTPTEMS